MNPRTSTIWTFAITSVALFMTTLDNLVVTTALPVIREDLHAGLSGLEWTVNAYTLTFAVLPPLSDAAAGAGFLSAGCASAVPAAAAITSPKAKQRRIFCMVVFPVEQGANAALQRSVGTEVRQRDAGPVPRLFPIVPEKARALADTRKAPRLRGLGALSFQRVPSSSPAPGPAPAAGWPAPS